MMNSTRLPTEALRPKGTDNILHALAHIQPGQLIVYHEGMLMRDRSAKSDRSNWREADEVGAWAYRMAARRAVDLFQIKEDRERYLYVARGRVNGHSHVY